MACGLYYMGSAEGHEYRDIQVENEVRPRTFLFFLKSMNITSLEMSLERLIDEGLPWDMVFLSKSITTQNV
jgi:hypothetical protein